MILKKNHDINDINDDMIQINLFISIFVGEQANLIFITIHQVTILIMKILFYSSNTCQIIVQTCQISVR